MRDGDSRGATHEDVSAGVGDGVAKGAPVALSERCKVVKRDAERFRSSETRHTWSKPIQMALGRAQESNSAITLAARHMATAIGRGMWPALASVAPVRRGSRSK